MLRPSSLSVGLLALLCLTTGFAHADTINFENLSNGSLIGQDGWISLFNTPVVSPGFGVDATKIVSVSGTNAVAMRPRGVAPTAQNGSVLQFDANLGGNADSTALFGLAVADGTQSIAFGLNVPGNGPQAHAFSFYLFDRSSQFAASHYVAAAIPAGAEADWYRLQLAMDFTANGGDGKGSISAENLTLGETIFTPIAGLQDINLGLTAANVAALQPTDWTQSELYVASGGALDNLSASAAVAATPEPGAYALILAGGLSGFVLRRHRQNRGCAKL